MKIGSIGYNHSHDSSFVMDRPGGPGAWLFLLIKSTALFEVNGERQSVKPDSFIIFSPDTPCMYKALEDVYTDDWFYFSVDDSDTVRWEKLGIPVDRIVHLGNIEELSQIMHILTFEHYSAEAFHEEVEQHYLEILLMKLSRLIKCKTHPSAGSFINKNASLTHIRTQIYTQPETVGNIDSLAQAAGMSRSGFQHLYKKMFGVSVINDVISGRIERAKHLLTSTSLTVEKIAQRCGYSSAFALIRQFRSRCGKTPTEYRKGI
ncbi:MAG: AraC family transcriptional regulator [Oscillospiraceae bacterium]